MDYKDSFIYKEFVQSLLKSAQAAPPAATPVAGPTIDPAASKSINDHAKQMIANLQKQISEFTADSADARLLPKNLMSLNALFLFLSENNIKKGGFSIVLPNDGIGNVTFEALSDSAKTQYSNYPDVDEDPDFFVHKALLIDYLHDLQSKNDPTLTTLLNARIPEANSQLKLDYANAVKGKNTTTENANDKSSAFYKDNATDPAAQFQVFTQRPEVRETVARLINLMPFRVEDVDFRKIAEFYGTYKTILGPQVPEMGGSAEAIAQYKEINDAMIRVSSYTKIRQTAFTLRGANREKFQEKAKDPQSSNYLPLIQNIRQVVGGAAELLASFGRRYGKQFDIESTIQSQLAIANQNDNDLALLAR